MNQNELKRAMDEHTPVYFINDENYDYHCKDMNYEVAEADVYKIYIPQQELYGTDTYLQFENGSKTLVPNKNIFSNPEDADIEAVRRFEYYVKSLRKKVKEAEEALAECEKRMREINTIDFNHECKG